jgi:hypothetical protein
MRIRPEVPALLTGLSLVGLLVMLPESPRLAMAVLFLQLLQLLWIFHATEPADAAGKPDARRRLGQLAAEAARRSQYASYEDLFRRRLETLTSGTAASPAARSARPARSPAARLVLVPRPGDSA